MKVRGQTESEADGKTEHMGDRQKDTDIKIDRWKDSQTERERPMERQTNRKIDKKAERLKHR